MGASLGGGDDDDGITAINITPFVDIILVVLIIFMVTTTTLVNRSIKVQLPEAATGEAVDAPTSLAIQLLADGGLTLDGAATGLDALRAALRAQRAAAQAEQRDLICLIGADKTVPHGRVVEVIDLIRQEGIAKFAIQIDPTPLPPEAVPAPAGG